MNYLQLVNAVLKKLREDTVADVDQDAYSTLIGQFVNETKEEVENSWQWSMLRTAVALNTTASTTYVDVLRTSVGPRDTIVKVRNATNYNDLSVVTADFYYDYLYGASTPAENIPQGFILTQASDPDYTRFTIYPTPDAVYNMYAIIIKRQAELTSGTDVLYIPSRPVILGAYYKAVKERGEDNGDYSAQAGADYKSSWNDAIALDKSNQSQDEFSWQVN